MHYLTIIYNIYIYIYYIIYIYIIYKHKFKIKCLEIHLKGNLAFRVFSSKVKKELFELAISYLSYSNFTKEEWTTMRSLADGRSMTVKKADKGSCVVVYDRNDYIVEGQKQLGKYDFNFMGSGR